MIRHLSRTVHSFYQRKYIFTGCCILLHYLLHFNKVWSKSRSVHLELLTVVSTIRPVENSLSNLEGVCLMDRAYMRNHCQFFALSLLPNW